MSANWHEEIFYVCREVYQICGESSEPRAREYRVEFERAICQVLAREKDDRKGRALGLVWTKGLSPRRAARAVQMSRSTLVDELSKKNTVLGIVLKSKQLYPPSAFFASQ